MRMICRTCHNEIPAGKLDCPVCLERISRRLYLVRMRAYGADIESGKVPLKLGRAEGQDHIQVFGVPQQSFCGLNFPQRRRRDVIYPNLKVWVGLCEQCKTHMQEIVEHQQRVAEAS